MKDKIEEILGRYTHDYIATNVGSKPIISVWLVNDLHTLIQQEREEAVREHIKGFGVWLGRYKEDDNLLELINEYLQSLESEGKNESP